MEVYAYRDGLCAIFLADGQSPVFPMALSLRSSSCEDPRYVENSVSEVVGGVHVCPGPVCWARILIA